ncbi:carbohydrate ABC transporter permease [Phycicoccus sonneratiae]|uniref:Carbohydrate ABC transporter permease n=1 Tax=Phycicoccus sonneratiae TaxID=2807628 RepID=A0ABS2CRI2_9MICO|nr:carbohydrate ABC transporter permease [Phycicoccus sonneraticus]MBM6401679.1 carbohydrate ABC transporter permease [Phycicoccus sonneraticus]
MALSTAPTPTGECAAQDPADGGPPPRRRWPFSPYHLLLAPLAVLFAMPLVQMVLASFKTDAEIRQVPPTFVPAHPTLSGYVRLFQDSDVLRWLLNSVIVSGSAIIAHLVLCSMAGYGFSRLRFAGRGASFVLLVGTIMIPTQLLMIPTYIMFTKLGVVNTLPAVILPWLTSAFGVFLMRQFFLSLPRELEEAGRLDGCSAFGVFWRVVLPLARPALATLAIFTLLGSWNDLIWPLIAINDDRWYTIQLGLANFQGQRRTEWSLLMAGNVVATMPMVLFFMLAQRQFVATMTFSGMKG